jgi:hypothetical protein
MLPTFDTRPRGARCQQDIADMEGILHPGAEIDRRQVAIGEGRCRKGARSMARGWGRANNACDPRRQSELPKVFRPFSLLKMEAYGIRQPHLSR